MNLPNKLTLTRIILLAPLLVAIILYEVLIKVLLVQYYIAGRILLAIMLLIFVAAMITDYFDGKIARERNLITTFGKLWDPLADKLIVSTTLIGLCAFGFVPIWITVLFVARDIVVDGFRIVMVQNNVEIAASKWGKLKTLFQTIAIIVLLCIGIGYDYSSPIVYLGLVNHPTLMYFVALYIINIPTMVALFFSIFSGVNYFKAIKPYIQSK